MDWFQYDNGLRHERVKYITRCTHPMKSHTEFPYKNAPTRKTSTFDGISCILQKIVYSLSLF